ncbi:anthranilate 1,2-dioxygenase regulatory protein AndR [uncultured Ramlibacter sp.]|uniref:anthranilate 1,2-dioxygenase regulatory protein AndR n=1 Tax=uncultured Ramlibacter sp. TaxID=260755 RepID=UPI00261E5798|nr:anthranilate 1,2-dioxygenase regulatory protein AndR [uncultured Ramlibacter sp.]
MSTASTFDPTALRAHRLFESHDLDDARERISRVMQPHQLRPLASPALRPHSHMDFTRIGALGLGTIGFGEAVQVDVGTVQDYHLLMFCLRGRAEVRTGDRQVQTSASKGVICAPGQTFVADLSADCEQFVVRLDRRAVEAHCGRAIAFDPLLDLGRPELQAWFEQLRLLSTSDTLLLTAQRRPLIAAELERLLVQLLLDGQAWSDAPASGRRDHTEFRAPAAGCVRRAEVYIEEHAGEPVRLADIADAAGVPVRTLLDAFQRFRDRSPMQQLRDVRLQRAREQLQAADEGTRVSTVALDCGFGHLGRFAQDYQRRFGETPSATLAARG